MGDGPDAVAIQKLRHAALAFAGTYLTTHNPDPLRASEQELRDAAMGYALVLEEMAGAAEIARLRGALEAVLGVCRDRQAFVMQGPRAFAKAEQIAMQALEAEPVWPSSGDTTGEP